MNVVIFGATGVSGKVIMVAQLEDKKYIKKAPSVSN